MKPGQSNAAIRQDPVLSFATRNAGLHPDEAIKDLLFTAQFYLAMIYGKPFETNYLILYSSLKALLFRERFSFYLSNEITSDLRRIFLRTIAKWIPEVGPSESTPGYPGSDLTAELASLIRKNFTTELRLELLGEIQSLMRTRPGRRAGLTKLYQLLDYGDDFYGDGPTQPAPRSKNPSADSDQIPAETQNQLSPASPDLSPPSQPLRKKEKLSESIELSRPSI